ncbi:MAG: hypothetical protein WBG86_22070, partial [Polyangiales bacterium]
MKNALMCVMGLALVGCGSKNAEPVTSPGSAGASTSGGEVADSGRCRAPGDGYEVTEYDTSGDDTADVRKLFKTMGEGSLSRLVLVCREADLNGDGRKDIVRFYTDEGRPQREEADRDFDGQIDEVTLFADGRINQQELDTTGNGVIDTRIFYEDGQPARAERDMKGRSTAATWKPDRWEYYVDGRTVRIGTDLNGDGKVDRWD